MAEEITLKVNVETGQAVGSLNKLDKVTGEVVKETNEMAIASAKGAKTLGDLEKASEDLTTRLKGAKFGTPEFKELNQALKDVNRQVKNTELNMEALDNEQVASEIGSVAGAVGDMTAAFILLGGDDDSALAETAARFEKAIGVSMAFKGAIEGIISFQKLWNNVIKETAVVQGLTNTTNKIAVVVMRLMGKTAGMSTKAFKLLKGAIMAIGIGLVIAGLELLISNFDKVVGAVKSALSWLGLYDDSAEKSAKKRKKQLAAESKARQKRLAEIKRAIEDEIRARDRIITSYDDEIRIAESLWKDTVELERQKLTAIIESFKKQKDLEIEGIRIRQLAHEQKIKHHEKELKNKADIFGIDKALLEAHKRQLEETLKDEEDFLAQLHKAEVDLVVFENKIQLKRREAYKKTAEENKKVTDKEIEDAKKAAEDKSKIEKDLLAEEIKLEDQQWQLLQELTNTQQEFELLKLAQQYDKKFELAQGNAELEKALTEQQGLDVAAIKDKFSKEAKDKEIADAQAINAAKTQLALDGLNAVMSLTSAFAKDNEKSQKKAFEINKKLQIAMALIQTYQGVQAIFATRAASPESILFPAAPFIAAGIALATGLANVQNIRKQQFSGGASGGSFGGGGGIPGGGGSAPQIDPVTNTSTLVPQEDQKVFVTETDISETQNKVSVIEAQSTF